MFISLTKPSIQVSCSQQQKNKVVYNNSKKKFLKSAEKNIFKSPISYLQKYKENYIKIIDQTLIMLIIE